jgi:hypothetical protein
VAAPGFGLVEAPFIDRLPHAYAPLLQIDIAPAQGQQLADAQAGKERRDFGGFPAGVNVKDVQDALLGTAGRDAINDVFAIE